jgi:hypothetical protein
MSAQHTPGRQCDECEGFCLRTATIDEANTALAVAGTRQERLLACKALIGAAQAEAQRLRAAIAEAADNGQRAPGPWEPVSLLRTPYEATARLVVRRLAWKDGWPESEYLPGTFATLEEARTAIALATTQAPCDLHPATADLVRRFSVALAEKLAAAEKKYGYSDGWCDPDWMDECRAKLLEHVSKGDPRDVAAYCAFLWHHGESTTATAPSTAFAKATGSAA